VLCLFDLDGTLIDSEHGITMCVKYALAKLDVPAPADEPLSQWIGPPLRQSFAPLLDNDAERIEAAVGYYHERFDTCGWREHVVYPGIEILIEKLLVAGHQLAAVTSKTISTLRQSLPSCLSVMPFCGCMAQAPTVRTAKRPPWAARP
jgi:phosphoglycolate phosphatase